ncbi:MAG: thioredoxin domain-containing protein [Planctomycetes bacterium]|nr:thioredoxin domain-containing protein [Planctomycetota bacterium]
MSISGQNSIQWLPWDDDSFRRARELDRPVFLTIVASWCRFCRELDETTFQDAGVIARIEENYVPVRVDKDRRPDINARYNCGGWPTVAFLTPTGDLIAGETFLTSAELIPILDRVAPFFREHRGEIHARVEELEEIRIRQQERREFGHISSEVTDLITSSIVESFDPVHGGFGVGSKFPHPEAIDFTLAQYVRVGNEQMRQIVTKTLDAMAGGEIYDSVEGGFFRYAQARDWRAPHTEKVLDSNAQRARFYLEAYQLWGNENYKKAAVGCLKWMESRLLDSSTGGFFGSQDADPEYYGLPIERRRTRAAPRVDRTIYSDWNAMAASTFLMASVVLNSNESRAIAARTLEFLVDEMFDERLGVYHYWDETFHLPGLLSDQAYVLRLFIDAVAYLGDSRYLQKAVKLASIIKARHHSSTGGYYDLSHDASDVKRPARRNRSVLENSVIAESFVKIGVLLRDEEYIKTARTILESFAIDYRQYGYYAAGFGRAVDLVLHPPLLVTVVGKTDDAVSTEMRLSALNCYIPNRVVDFIDPKRDGERLRNSGLPAGERATAFISVGRASYAEVIEPSDLPSVMRMAENDRAQ